MKQQQISEHEEELAKLRFVDDHAREMHSSWSMPSFNFPILPSRHDLEAVTTELDQVKESYVVLSEESRWIEKQTRERCEEEASERMKEVRQSHAVLKYQKELGC